MAATEERCDPRTREKTVSKIRPTAVGPATLFPVHGNVDSDWEQCARSRSEAVAKLRQGYGQGSIFDTVNTRVRVIRDWARLTPSRGPTPRSKR